MNYSTLSESVFFKEVVMRRNTFTCGIAMLLLGYANLSANLSANLMAQETKPAETKPVEKKPVEKKPAESAEKGKQAAPAKPAWNPYSTLQQYKIVAAIDEDLDGTISAKEIETSLERILKLDVDGDGKLSSAEFLKEGTIANIVSTFGVVKGLDADKDGALSAEEIKGAVEVLKKLDANKNGKLEPQEYSMKSPMSMGGGGGGGSGGGGRQMPSPEEFMKQNDKNSDGKVEKSELAGPAANFFDRMDENKDGAITLEEVKASRERMRQQGGGSGGGGGGGGRGGRGGAPSGGAGEKPSESPKTNPPK